MLVWAALIWIASVAHPVKRAVFGRQVIEDALARCTIALIILFTSIVYAFTYYKLSKQARNMASLRNGNRSQRLLKEKRFFRTILLIASIAIVC